MSWISQGWDKQSTFVCKQTGTKGCSNTLVCISQTEKNIWANISLRERWPKQLRYGFPPPKMIPLILGRLVSLGGDLIMITPFYSDQSWLPEIMHLATEPLRYLNHFCGSYGRQPPGKWSPKVRENIQLTAWRLPLPSVPGIASKKELQWKTLTPGKRNKAKPPLDVWTVAFFPT